MKKGLLLLLFSGVSIVSAKSFTTVMPYSAYIDYSNSNKDKAYVVGVYSSYYNFPNKFELGLENINIEYNNNLPRLDQNDITAIYTRFVGEHLYFKGGLHYIKSDDSATDNGIIAIAGVNYYQYLKYNVGLDFYYSKYKNYQPKKLKLYQVRPYVGVNFGKYYSKWGSFYLEGELNYIKPISSSVYGLKKSYTSGGLKLVHYKGKWTNSVGGWIGKKVFAVDNGGFTVYNLGETYKAGIEASVDYAFRTNTHMKIKYNYSKFTETNKKAHSNVISASLSHTW